MMMIVEWSGPNGKSPAMLENICILYRLLSENHHQHFFFFFSFKSQLACKIAEVGVKFGRSTLSLMRNDVEISLSACFKQPACFKLRLKKQLIV